jgi:hypothetical protein
MGFNSGFKGLIRWTGAEGGQPGSFIQGSGKGLLLPQNVEKDSGVHAASYSLGAWDHFRG